MAFGHYPREFSIVAIADVFVAGAVDQLAIVGRSKNAASVHRLLKERRKWPAKTNWATFTIERIVRIVDECGLDDPCREQYGQFDESQHFLGLGVAAFDATCSARTNDLAQGAVPAAYRTGEAGVRHRPALVRICA